MAAKMFPDGVESPALDSRFTACPRPEYLKLIVRHLRAGQCGLRLNVNACGPVFAVGKPGKNIQREVWNGGEIARCARQPPKPPLHVTPTSLAHLEASPGQPIWISKKDDT